MKAKEFLKSLEFKVNGPAYSGAPKPKYVSTSINESEFDQSLRLKFFDCDYSGGNEYKIKYISQSWTYDENEIERFFNEVARCLKFAASKAKLEEDVVFSFTLESRDNYEDGDQRCDAIIRIEGNTYNTTIERF